MTFYRDFSGAINPIYDQVLKHPFIVQLTSGTLDKQIFQFYLLQDQQYLCSFYDVIGIITQNCAERDEKQVLTGLAESIKAEMKQLHTEQLSLVVGAGPSKQSPACFLYMQFLLAEAKRDYLSGLAAILPCYWIYNRLARALMPDDVNHPYLSWFLQYANQQTDRDVCLLMDLCDKHYVLLDAKEKLNMIATIKRASVFEWCFWDDAFHQKQLINC